MYNISEGAWIITDVVNQRETRNLIFTLVEEAGMYVHPKFYSRLERFFLRHIALMDGKLQIWDDHESPVVSHYRKISLRDFMISLEKIISDKQCLTQGKKNG